MINSKDCISIIIVGTIWGCTNPFMKKGSEDEEAKNISANNQSIEEGKESVSFLQGIIQSLSKFRRCSVFVPYLLNQSGSLFYYKLLATSDLSNAIPTCNALAMVFSFLTSFLLGERLDKPIQAVLGSLLVTGGVIVCMFAAAEDDANADAAQLLAKSGEEEL